ncbi:hypothetical protein [Streptomyces sp. NPDC088789]|uniref:hypothetical protein n=1 Tax=Streptomyces sp. NPDC088789 TaxID=3365899 RepID=UPI0037FF45AA
MTAPHPRTTRSGREPRILRAAVFAAVCVVLAAAGHSLASYAPIPLWALGAGFAGVLVVAVPFAGRVRSLAATVALLAGAQALLHALFGLGQHGGAAGAVPSADASLVARAARLVCGTPATTISPAEARRILTDARIPAPDHAPGVAGPASAGSPDAALGLPGALLPSLPMLLGHLLAAVAVGWLLRRGDLALLRLVDLSALSARAVAEGMAEGALVRSLRAALTLVRALCAGLPATPEAAAGVPRAARLTPPGPRTTALQHTVIRRGPPPAGFDLAA